jgi:hypothetical protein
VTPRQIAEAFAKHTIEVLARTADKDDFERVIADAFQIVAEEETKRERRACFALCQAAALRPTTDDAALIGAQIQARGM